MGLRVLVVGGTGVISAAVVRRALALGHDVTVLNRGRSAVRPVPDGIEVVEADVRDAEAVDAALLGRTFDVVAQFLAFVPQHVEADLARFRGAGQYLFVSSATVYRKPPDRLPITEGTPLGNPFSQYARDKIACEERLTRAWRDDGFPVTVVRPSHTYDDTAIPTLGGWTDVARMRAGRPVVVHGDGTSLWTLTHVDDFAVGFCGLFGRPEAEGGAFTITGDSAPTWNQVFEWLGRAAGAEPHLVHVASDDIARAEPALAEALLGDRTHSALFDTTRLRALVPEFRTTVPYAEGARRQVAWYDAHPEAQREDERMHALWDRLAERAARD